MKTDRLIAIIMILLQRDKITAKELAEQFEISQRTIYRDLESINQAGIPIVSTPGPSGGVEILKSFQLEKRLFSTSDITALLMGLESMRHNVPSHDFLGALAKVKGIIPPEQQRELSFRANQIKIDATPWLSGGGFTIKLELIKTALEHLQLLRFTYHDLKNNKSHREIEPYRLLLKGEDWYVQGFCLARQDFRTFKLLRMQNVVIMDKTFEIREFPYAKMDSAHFQDKQLIAAKLRIHESIQDAIVARFGEDCLTADGPHHYIAAIHLPLDALACNYILGFGAFATCLEPVALKEQLRNLAKQIYEAYED